MGRWGGGFFEGDKDLDHISDISTSLDMAELLKEDIKALELRLKNQQKAKNELENGSDSEDVAEDEELDSWESDLYFAAQLHDPKFPALVRDFLNSGELAGLIDELSPSGDIDPWDGAAKDLTLVVACAMQLGCHFPAGFIQRFKAIYPQLRLLDKTVAQIKTACDEYIDGKPYNMNSVGLLTSANLQSLGIYTHFELDVPSLEAIPAGEFPTTDKSTAPIIIPYVLTFPLNTCTNCGSDKCPDGTELKRCGDCHKALFCCTGCMKWRYNHHADECDPEKAQERADRTIEAAKLASLNEEMDGDDE